MTNFPLETHDQKAVLGVALSFSILAVFAVSLRLFAHTIAHKNWTPSDYLIIAACVFAVGLQSISAVGVLIAGIGYGHVSEVILEYGLEPITKLSQLIIPLQFLWVLSLSCTKMSVLWLYLRIRLDDDTSHLWLRPMGLHHHADVLAAENMSIADEESLERHEADYGICSQGIQVKQSFHVSEKGGASQ